MGARAAAPPAGRLDLLVDLALGLLAAWTLAYHLGLLLSMPLLAVALVWVALSAGVVVWLTRGRPSVPSRGRRSAGRYVPVGLACAMAVFSLLLTRPDADDIVYVGRSVAVRQLGLIPTRDTVFSAGVYPPVASGYPPVTSWETLLGAVARAAGLEAGTVVYLVATPVGAAVAVLALHRLLVSWRVSAPSLALVAALVFILWGGADHASFGNLHVGRIWQGKVLFVAVVVPYLYAVGTDWLRSRSRRSLILMTGASVAGVGLTTSAFFVVPVVACVLGVVAVLRRDLRAAAGAAAVAVYPVTTALVSVSVPGAPPLPDVSAPGSMQVVASVLGSGAVVVPAVVGLALGWLGARGVGRAVALLSVLGTCAVLAPATLHTIDAATGAGLILWRLAWVAPLPALVGAAVSLLASARSSPAWRGLVAVLAVGALVGTGLPLWSPKNAGAAITLPRWKVPEPDLEAARQVVSVATSDGASHPVLAPTSTSFAVSLVSARVHPVVSRGDYMAALRSVPGGHLDDRLLLERFADGDRMDGEDAAVLRALSELDVAVACVETEDAADELLTRAGWRASGTTPTCALFTSPGR
ncbi:MAG: DUF6077 domain-containing protein [Actinomycetes bacterium]